MVHARYTHSALHAAVCSELVTAKAERSHARARTTTTRPSLLLYFLFYTKGKKSERVCVIQAHLHILY